jgi:anaerobic dimethyl sulfoxide reductase subunit C (anchor subunit)
MNLLHEWPLVLFTITVQLAVGLHLALLAAEALPGQEDPGEPPGFRGRPFLLVGVLMAGALVISLLHLGAPVNALRTLSNLDESWLSREILAALVFLGLWGLDFVIRRRWEAVAPERPGPEPESPPGPAPGVSRVLAWATALAGLVLIWVMARIYMVPARPLWDHWLTAAGFFLTTFLLGAVVAAAHVVRRSPSGTPAQPALPPTGAALLALGVTVALAQMAATLAHPVTLEVATDPQGTPLVALRLGLLLAGAFLLVIPLAASAFPKLSSAGASRPGRWAAAALLLLGGSEVLGRMLFYAAGVSTPF